MQEPAEKVMHDSHVECTHHSACYCMELVHEITLLPEEVSSPLQCLMILGI